MLPQLNTLQQIKTEDEINTYMSVFQDIGNAEFVLWLMKNPESGSFQIDSALGVNPPTGKYPQLLAWCWNQNQPEIVENSLQLGELGRWIQQPVFNLINLPVSHQDEVLGFIQIANFKDLPQKRTQENLARLLGHYLITHQQLMESNRWAGRLQQLLEFIGSISSSLDPDQILRMLLEQVSLLLDTEASSLYLIDDASGEAILHLSSRTDHRLVENYRVPQGKG
jgi:GAF domain-containing protein